MVTKLLNGNGLMIDSLILMTIIDGLQTIKTNETIYFTVLIIAYQLMSCFVHETKRIFILLHFYL